MSGDDAEAVREQMKREILEEYEKNREPSDTSLMNLPISTSFKLKIAGDKCLSPLLTTLYKIMRY